MQTEFIEAVNRNQDAFGLTLSDEQIERLDAYYRIVQEHNPILHLVGKCSEAEFAVRHVLESIYVLSFTGKKRTFVDIGSGAGLPGIPCLISSEHLRGYLVESKERKCVFLNETVERLGLAKKCEVVNRQFEEIVKPNAGVVVSRALDKFTKKLPALIEWSGRSTVALFAGENVRLELERLGFEYSAFLIPLSERRFVFIVEHKQPKHRRTFK